MQATNTKYVPVTLCQTSTLVPTAAFWLEFIPPRFQILDSESAKEQHGLLPTKSVTMRQTQIYFLIVIFLFFSHFLSFPKKSPLIHLLKTADGDAASPQKMRWKEIVFRQCMKQ